MNANWQVIQNSIYTVYGKPWYGKTLFCLVSASSYKIIYSNFRIYLNGKQVSNDITSIEDLDSLVFNPTKSVFIMDEGGVNNNARRSSSDANMEFWKLAMLGRKLNMDIFQISQLERMADVYYRELSECSVQMTKPKRRGANDLIFYYDIYRGDTFEWSVEIDMLQWMKDTGYSYDTLESGKIDLKGKWNFRTA